MLAVKFGKVGKSWKGFWLQCGSIFFQCQMGWVLENEWGFFSKTILWNEWSFLLVFVGLETFCRKFETEKKSDDVH